MNFFVMTLFPEIIENAIDHSIIKRARQNNIISVNSYNIRDFSTNKHKKVDDYPFGGGAGMVMAYQPIVDCYNEVIKNVSDREKTRTIYLSPSGNLFNQEKAKELKNYDNLIFLCGHYEGVDQRAIDTIVDEEISIGDYVLTGGEIPAIVLIETISRLLDGVLSNSDSYENESFSNNLLEHPQYTRPSKIDDLDVPAVLLNGNHKEIENWRLEESVKKTIKIRPDLLKKINFDVFDKKQKEIIKKILQNSGINDIII